MIRSRISIAQNVPSTARVQVGAIEESIRTKCADCPIELDYFGAQIDEAADIDARIARSLARLTSNEA